jgi:hypothetical protein
MQHAVPQSSENQGISAVCVRNCAFQGTGMLPGKMVSMAAVDRLITCEGDGWKVEVLLHVALSPELLYFDTPHLHRS